ncbi:DUF1129 family protein [Macrococcus hajekii]|uniref:DUF1129 family protein n=1 Tax=Macrococcus hajekii TaxID=198482 RepID=A0A4R6BJ74_9STAP|nr:DUF1129 family protein [Macrococcus hajekii]TDM01606.1 DUF1129 family protein [Macrococcus hajekii]GGB01424.1 hypothetical protein GCM10007190_06870 [Macrococcus hajekii]
MHTTELLGKEIENKEKQMNIDFYNDFSSIRRYIMTDFSLSHHQSLELLNELADHILESQSNGATAQEFFGDNLELYANELVEELPTEKTFFKLSVIGYAVFNVLGLLFLLMMIVELFVTFTSSGHFEFYPVALIVSVATFLFGVLGSLFILLKFSHVEEFKDRKYNLLKELPIYAAGGITILGSQMIFKNMDVGPKTHLNWYMYIVLALIAVVIGYLCSNKAD